MKKDKERPKVGLGVMIMKDERVLLGKRKNSHGAGTWSFPGGHLELNESFEKCLRREVREESGLRIKNLNFLCAANIKKYGKHYVLIGFGADWRGGEPKVLEKEKCEVWKWFDLNKLPRPLFEASRLMIESYKKGKICFDI